MPTNLPPEFFEAERKYKEAISNHEKISVLEEMMSTIPKHKGTDKLRADYRKKISRLKTEAHTNRKVSKHESQFHIEKEGDGRVIIVGSANTGKSSLLNLLSHASPEISSSPFSTWAPLPGMMEYDKVHIQLIDTPPINRDYIEPECYDLLRSADSIIIMLDLQAYPIRQLEETLKKLEEGWIAPYSKRHRYNEPRMRFIPMVIVVNKMDDFSLKEEFDVLSELYEDEWVLIPISIESKFNLEGMEREIISRMHIIRVYSKPPHSEPDKTQPFILHENATVGDFAIKVHKDFYQRMKTARIWGKGVFNGQQVSKEHVLSDGDIVELNL